MKKYQELETKIKELQAEVERLKNKEKANKLPKKFDRDQAMTFLQEPSYTSLDKAFIWDYTPQGVEYWEKIADEVDHNKKYKIPTDAIIQLQKWVIQSYQEEYETSL